MAIRPGSRAAEIDSLWEPITYSHSIDSRVYLERSGNGFLTIFNDGAELRAGTITLEQKTSSAVRELVNGHTIRSPAGQINLILKSESREFRHGFARVPFARRYTN